MIRSARSSLAGTEFKTTLGYIGCCFSKKNNVSEYKEVSTIMKSVVVKYVSGVEEKFQSNKEKMG